MPESKEILTIINEIIEAERGNILSPGQLLTESDMDSFSYAVFWLTLADNGIDLKDEWIDTLNYETLTIQMIIDKIQEDMSHGTH
jgi:hypothetical protein